MDCLLNGFVSTLGDDGSVSLVKRLSKMGSFGSI